jgi:hypothetical protein
LVVCYYNLFKFWLQIIVLSHPLIIYIKTHMTSANLITVCAKRLGSWREKIGNVRTCITYQLLLKNIWEALGSIPSEKAAAGSENITNNIESYLYDYEARCCLTSSVPRRTAPCFYSRYSFSGNWALLTSDTTLTLVLYLLVVRVKIVVWIVSCIPLVFLFKQIKLFYCIFWCLT